MKKHIIAFLILLIAAGVSVGVFLKVRDKKEKETKQKEVEIADLSLFSFDSSVIDKIEIKNPEGSYTAQLQDKKWVLTDGGDFVLDQDYMILMCTYFSTLTASDTHTGSPESYGLDEANASTITLSGGGQSYTINIGNVSPTKEYYYVTVEGKSKIYSVASVYDGGNNFSTEKMILKSKHLVEYGDNDISQITIIRDGKIVCDLTYDEESAKWSLPEEYSLFELDVTAVTSMINVMTRLEAEQMLDEDLTDMSKYGFDDPYAEVIVLRSDSVGIITDGNDIFLVDEILEVAKGDGFAGKALKGLERGYVKELYVADNVISLTDEDTEKVMNLINALEDIDDVQAVYHNLSE